MKSLGLICVSAACLAASYPLSATTVWAGTQGGVYKSLDSGTTWQQVPVPVSDPLLAGNNPPTPDVASIAVDPQQPANVYFLGKMQGSSAWGFYRSRDSGKTWASTVPSISLADPSSYWTAWVLVDPVMTNVVYLGWTSGVLRSTDYGATFTKLTLPAPNGSQVGPQGLSVDPANAGVLYLSSLASVYRSADYGNTWSAGSKVVAQSSGLDLGPVVVDPRNSNVLYVGNSGGSPSCGPPNAFKECGLFRSADAGTTWTNVTPEGAYQEVVFDAGTTDLYLSGNPLGIGLGVQKSTDNGNTWAPVSNKQGPHLVADPFVSKTLYGYIWADNEWFKSTDGGVTLVGGVIVTTGSGRGINQLAVPRGIGNVSAASFLGGPVSPESIVSALGGDLATVTMANTAATPPTSLGGTIVTVTDSTGASRQAPLFYVSQGQVNYEIPAGTALGVAKVAVQSADGFVSSSPLGIVPVSPGLFQLNASGLAAAFALRISGGTQTYENVYQLDAGNNVIPKAIDLGPSTDQVYLLLYGTGIRGAKAVTITVNGVSVPVGFAGAQGQFLGEDQVNVGPLPRSLAGVGNVQVALAADGIGAQPVNVTF